MIGDGDEVVIDMRYSDEPDSDAGVGSTKLDWGMRQELL